jgi:hypothetical protein
MLLQDDRLPKKATVLKTWKRFLSIVGIIDGTLPKFKYQAMIQSNQKSI